MLRRVIRRAVHFGRRIGLESPFMFEVSRPRRASEMQAWYPELEQHRREIEEHLRAEEERFSETLARGERLFEEVAGSGAISGDDAFRLHDTYGFPLELTRELAAERGLVVDEETFTRLMAEQRERSRAGVAVDRARSRSSSGPPTEFVGYEKTEVLTAISALEELGDGEFQAKLHESPFYAEGGGQVTDTGFIEHEETGARAELERAVPGRRRPGARRSRGEGFAAGDRVRAVVAWRVRFPTMANHTATHLLQAALREVLGEQVRQAGSAVRPDKLRFDFTHGQALTAEERERGRAARQREGVREHPGARVHDADRRGAEARRDDAVRREVRRPRARGRDRRASRASSAAARTCARRRRSGRSRSSPRARRRRACGGSRR